MPTQGNLSVYDGQITIKTVELYNQEFLEAAKEFNEAMSQRLANDVGRILREVFLRIEPDPIQEAAELYEWLEGVT